MKKEYYELEIVGSLVAVREFVNGFLMGKELEGEVFFAKDEWIRSEPLWNQIMEKLRLVKRRTIVIVEKKLHKPLMTAFRAGEHETGLRVHRDVAIAAASFRFSFKAFTKKHGDEIREIFEDLPDGVFASEDYRPEVVGEPSAFGVEGYAPLHNYVVQGRGLIGGHFRGVLDVYREAQHHPLIDTGDLLIEHK